MAKYIDIDHEIQEMQQVIEIRKNSHTFENDIAAYAFKSIIEKFQSLPPADVAPVVHAKWIERWHENKHVIGDMACSACGAQMLLTFPKFCPNCGAKMDKKEKNE